jgi:hypothetical protein
MSRQRKILVAIVIAIVLLSAGGYAYLASLPPPPGPLVTVASPPLQFSMQIDKTEYNMGENITMTFWLKNTSNKTITITYPDFNVYFGHVVLFDFIITDMNGTEIYRWSSVHAHLCAKYKFTLNPGEEINQTNFWSQDTYWEEGKVPAGTYYIRAAMPSSGAGAMFGVTGNTHGIRLETPSIMFLIR